MNRNTGCYQVQEQGKISARQLAFLVITYVIATADVFLPAFVAQEAGEDSWISVIIATVFSLLVVLMLLILGLKHPDKTLIQYSCDILGKPLGKLVGFIYIYYFSDVAFAVTRELGDIYLTAFNPFAPLAFYIIVALLVAAYAVLKGLEVIVRVNEFLLPVGLFILLFIAVVNIPNMDFSNFLPVLNNGMVPPLRGALLIQAWMLETVLILQFIPFVQNKHKVKKSVMVSIFVLGMSMGIGVLTIAVFGPLTGRLLFPSLEYVRIADLGRYIRNLDITIMGVWIAGIFIKIVIFYYGVVLALSQLFEFKSYKRLVVPVGLLITAVSVASSERIIGVYNFAHFTFPFYSLTMGFIIPFILLIVSLIKEKT